MTQLSTAQLYNRATKLYTKLYELPHFFFLEPLRLGRKHSRGHLTSTKLLRILTLNDELLLQASPNIYFYKAIK